MAQTKGEEIAAEDVLVESAPGLQALGASQDMVVETVGGLPVLRCTIRFGEYEIEANLIFDISLGVPLQIHKSSLGGLGLDASFAKGFPLDIEFKDGVKLMKIPLDTERYPMLETHTRLYAQELDEAPVVGFIGPAAFKSNVIELDMSKGLLRTMGLASDSARAAEVPYEALACGFVVGGTGPGGVPLRAVISTQRNDLALSPAVLAMAKEKGFKSNEIKLAEVSWGERSAIRFEPLAETWPETVNAVIGAEALASCTVTIWPKRNTIAFETTADPDFPEAEQQYFFALADRNSEAVLKFIESNPRRRLLDEACLNLWIIKLDDPSSTLAELKGALETIAGHYAAGRRSETLLNLTDTLEATNHVQREELVETALQLAIREAGGAVEQTAIHDVHVRIGRRAFAKGDLQQARRHLLSAAFGMPRNAECNYWMGEVYRETGKLRRAWSRYCQALLDEKLEDEDPVRALALTRIGELNRDPDFRKEFDMITAEEYMSGRLESSEFHAETRYRFQKDRNPHHVRMVEFFVNSSDEFGGGMELAFQALDEFFEGEVVLVSYHLDDPMHSEAARKRLDFYNKKSPPLAVFDGKPMFDEALGKGEVPSEDAAIHYPLLRDACLTESAPEASAWTVDGVLGGEGDRLKLGVSVAGDGATDDLRLVVLLCEKSVMEVEGNGVFFHHFVVRDLLTPPDGLELKAPFGAEIDLPGLRQRLAAAKPSGKSNAGPYIDSRQLFAVAFVQRRGDSRILATKKITFPESP